MTPTGSKSSGGARLAKHFTAGAGLSHHSGDSDRSRSGSGKYPFPATLWFISEGLKRLRAARANSEVQRSLRSRLEVRDGSSRNSSSSSSSGCHTPWSALGQWCVDTLPLRGDSRNSSSSSSKSSSSISSSSSSSHSSSSSQSHLAVTVLWRGMRDMKLSRRFWREGGSELACMSTSSDRGVAGAYAKSDCPLILKIRSSDFMSCGVDISFLSMFPNESEFLYPPLTYLKPRARVSRGNKTIILLEPSFPT